MRPRTRSIHLAGRISLKNSSEEDIDFVETKISENMTDTAIISKAIHVWRLYETGQIFKDIKNDLKKELLAGLTETLKNMNIAHMQTSVAKFDEKEAIYPKSSEEDITKKSPSQNQEIQYKEFTENEMMEIYEMLNNK